ncbi:hypothetical protein [Streptomyces gardneri]|uniref:hypothetical protein n=1 Tax=Streptomyces gardneri TaxID=66892 RepID=UPI0033CD9D5B
MQDAHTVTTPDVAVMVRRVRWYRAGIGLVAAEGLAASSLSTSTGDTTLLRTPDMVGHHPLSGKSAPVREVATT